MTTNISRVEASCASRLRRVPTYNWMKTGRCIIPPSINYLVLIFLLLQLYIYASFITKLSIGIMFLYSELDQPYNPNNTRISHNFPFLIFFSQMSISWFFSLKHFYLLANDQKNIYSYSLWCAFYLFHALFFPVCSVLFN